MLDKPVRKKASVKKKPSKQSKKGPSIKLDSAIRMRSSIDTMKEFPVKAMKNKTLGKVMKPEVVSAFKAGHSLVLTKREDDFNTFLDSTSSLVTSKTPTPSVIKKLMRSLTLECFQKIFFEVSGDLVAISRDRELPPVARGIARLALRFHKTGDIHILNSLTNIMGLMDKASSLDDGPEEMRDYLINAMIKYDKEREREDNIIDVGGRDEQSQD